jgi:hypothetical protein
MERSQTAVATGFGGVNGDNLNIIRLETSSLFSNIKMNI